MAARYPENDEGIEVTDSPLPVNQGDRASQSAMAAPAYAVQERNPGIPSQMVPEAHQGALQDKCILETPIGEAPHTDNLKRMLKMRLDPPRLRGDIKSLASEFGYTAYEIDYSLTTKNYGSPTEDLLKEEGWRSIKVLLDKLVAIGREDAAGKVRDYISLYCKCKGCKKALC